MENVLLRAIGFFCVIALGYGLKRRGFVKKSDATIFSTIVMTITLPCALLSSVASVEVSTDLFFPLFLGFSANLLLDWIGYWVSRKGTDLERSVGLVQLSGYNIGTFTLPFVQAFFPLSQLATVLLFDTGNAVMVLGGNYTLAAGLQEKNNGLSIRSIATNLSRSIPLFVYLITLCLSVFQIRIPEEWLSMTAIAGNANPFLAMLMLGILVDIQIDKKEVAELVKLLAIRLGINMILALGIYYWIPLSLSMRQMLVLCLFSPISVMSPVYCLKLGSSSSRPANVNSISILVSLCCMFVLLLLFAR